MSPGCMDTEVQAAVDDGQDVVDAGELVAVAAKEKTMDDDWK